MSLSIPDYRHINFQWFPHFSIIAPIFNWESFGLQQVEMAVAFLYVFRCTRRWPITFDALFLMFDWSSDFLFCFIFIYWSALAFNSCTPGWVFGINLSLFLHKIFFKLGPVWNATLNSEFCIFLLDFLFGVLKSKGK